MDRILDLDYRLSFWLHEHNSGLIGAMAKILSSPGSERIFIPCAGIVAIVAFLERQYVGAAALLAVAAATRIFIELLKRGVRRPRPLASGLRSSSFPSGHAMAGAAVYGTAAFVLTHSDASLLPAIAVWSGCAAVTIGIARVIRGFHWLTDVAAGAALGLALLIAVCVGLNCL